MRVTNTMVYKDFLRNLDTNMNKAQKYQNQLSSLEEISKSSDDPLLMSKILNLQSSISANENYASTIKDALSWSQTQDSALSSVTDSLQRIRTLIESSGTDSQGADELAANKSEIVSEIESMVDSLNTNFDGRYIFSGQKTQTRPFEVVKNTAGEVTGIQYNGSENAGSLEREVAKGVSIDMICDGKQILNESGTADVPDNLSTFFSDVLTALNNGDTAKLSGVLLEKADDYTENVVDLRTRIGATYNRLEATQERNTSEKTNLNEVLSNKQGIDLAEKYMEYSNQMVAYQASLAMGTKVLQTSILDYL